MLVTSCLLQLLVSFFMEGKCSATCAAWCAEACHQLSNLSFVFCWSKPSSEATLYDIKYPLLSSGRPSWRFGVLKLRITTHVLQPLILIGKDCSDQPDPCGGFKSRIFQKSSVISLSSSLVFPSQSHGIKGDQKYSENLGSTIEEHQPCHFRSTMIGGVTIPFTQKTAASERVVFTGVARYCTPERLREHAKEGTNAISYEPDVEKTLRRNTSSNRTEITHSLICFMVILA
ncbi:hypothetical protein IGI04_026080 [Brassica rapa subsp. trilocularis]|uniref:Secreted protein n=1 Tax=Brassica rapa subsp. trilocularis TaxID=1813537 RepID=A0ABQ7KYT6_BRACM|nr:hypothetical protein IGI04_026080 [Brassica rapa subsp. trilocularis]